jgi:hypothetical protein
MNRRLLPWTMSGSLAELVNRPDEVFGVAGNHLPAKINISQTL